MRADDIVRITRAGEWAGVEAVHCGRVDRHGRHGVIVIPESPLVRSKQLWFPPEELEATGRVYGRRTPHPQDQKGERT